MSDRERIWKLLFKDKPMPEQTDNAVEECFGMLNDVLGDISEEEFNEILMEVKGKGVSVYDVDEGECDE